MNCGQVKELLSAYLDNALAPEEFQEVATHVHTCTACRRILVDFRNFDALLSRLPCISPNQELRQRIFYSPEYLELTGTFGMTERFDERTVLYQATRGDISHRPRLVVLPGGRSAPSVPSKSLSARHKLPHKRRRLWGLHTIIWTIITATILLTIGLGSLMSWGIWKQSTGLTQSFSGHASPANPHPGPIPAGMRFIFIRNGTLWSAPADGGTGLIRLTSNTITVATNWSVRPALPGRPAGNMLAYIDLRQGFVHTIRSDGQSDTVVQQPLLKPGILPSTIWDTDNGSTILNSLAWSRDGSMLAFVADPKGTGSPCLYIYSLGTHDIQQVTLSVPGRVSHPVWSPDSIRVAFVLTNNGNVGIWDYNTQNHGILTIAATVNTRAHPNDTVLTLDWSPNIDLPMLTWSVGMAGHIHSIWLQHVGIYETLNAQVLANGDYTQATYSQAGDHGIGSWLLISFSTGLPSDITSVDLLSSAKSLTHGKQASLAQWSLDGVWVDYFDTLTSGIGTLHVINTTTGVDSFVATGVVNNPIPVWSTDNQHLAYSTNRHTLVTSVRTIKMSQPLKLPGSASALSWSTLSPHQLVLATSDEQQGIYLVDTQHDTSLQLDTANARGPILWAQIP